MRDDHPDTKLRFPEDLGGAKNNAEAAVLRARVRLHEAQAEFDEKRTKTPEQVETDYEAYKAKRLAEYETRLTRSKPINERAARLRSEVADWQPPSEDHEHLKKLMVQQLDILLDNEGRLPKRPEFSQTAMEDHNHTLRWMEESWIVQCKEQLTEALKKANAPDAWRGNVVWIEELIASVPPPPGTFEED
jgi:hypothetical protein